MTNQQINDKLAELRELWKVSLPSDRKIIEARARALQYGLKTGDLFETASEIFK
jgi:hypothetical protein